MAVVAEDNISPQSESEVYFEETFGSPSQVSPQPLTTSTTSGYRDWRLPNEVYDLAKAAGTETNIIQDPDDANNNILHMVRTTAGTGNDNPQFLPTYTLPLLPTTDKVKLSFKMKTTEDTYYISFSTVLDYLRHDYAELVGGHRFTPANDEQREALATKNVWHTYELVVDYTNSLTTLFVDTIQIGDAYEGTIQITQLRPHHPRYKAIAGSVYLDDIKIEHIPDPEWVSYADILNGQDKNNVSADLNLMEVNDIYSVAWESSKPEVISISGEVNVPTYVDEYVKLTATVTKTETGALMGKKYFDVVVPTSHTSVVMDDFEVGQPGDDLVTDYTTGLNGWVLSTGSYAGNTPSTLALAKSEGTLLQIETDPLDDTNQALHMTRIVKGSARANWIASKTVSSTINSGMYYVSVRMMHVSTSATRFMFEPFGLIYADKIIYNSGLNNAARYDYTDAEKEYWKTGQWNTVGILLNFDADKAQLYVNGNKVGEEMPMSLPSVSELRVYLPRADALGELYIDDLNIKPATLPEILTYDDILNGQTQDNVRNALDLMTSKGEYTIDWATSKPDVVSRSGEVTVPTLVDEYVTLTATITKTSTGNVVETKTFNIIVPTSEPNVWTEDFEAGNVGADFVTDYETGINGWVLSTGSYAGNNPSTLELAKSEGTLTQIQSDPSDDTNKALHMTRAVTGTARANWIPTKTINSTIDSGMYYVTARMMYIKSSTQFMFEPFGLIYPDKIVYSSNINNAVRYNYTEEEKAYWKPEQWNALGFLLNFDDGTAQLYINGNMVGPMLPMTLRSLGEIRIYLPRANSVGELYLDDIRVRRATLTDEKSVEKAKKQLEIEVPTEGVTEDIKLPLKGAFGTTIEWTSSADTIIGIDGTVTRPIGSDVTVTLKASISKNDVTPEEKEFTVLVKGITPLEAEAKTVTFEMIGNGQPINMVTQNLNLIREITGTYANLTIDWESDKEEVIALDGTVAPEDYYTTVNLKATIKEQGTNSPVIEKYFAVGVLGKGKTIFSENFESDEYEVGMRINGRNGWRQFLSTPHGHEITMEKDPQVEENHALYLDKFLSTSEDPDLLNEQISHDFEKQATGMVSISFRFFATTTGHYIGFELYDDTDSAKLISDIRYNKWFVEGGLEKANDEVPFGSSIAANKWHSAEALIDFDKRNIKFTLNGNVIGEKKMTLSEFHGIRFKAPRTRGHQSWYIDDIVVQRLDIADTIAVGEAADALTLDLTARADFIIPKLGAYNTEIAWATSDETSIEIVDNFAIVHRAVGQDKTATLTATITRGKASVTKQFPIVLPEINITEVAVGDFEFEDIGGDQKSWLVTENLSLPNEVNGASVTWTSSSVVLDATNGVITPQKKDVPVTLTADFTLNGVPYQKTFEIVVLGNGEVLAMEDFSASGSAEGQDISGWNEWQLEDFTGYLNGVKATVEKDPYAGLTPFEDAEKVLSFNRYNLKADGKVYNQCVMKAITPIKKEITRIDFDYMFHVIPSTMYVELEGMMRHYFISTTGIGLKGCAETPFGKTLETYKWYHISIEQDAYNNTYNVYLDYQKLNDEPIYAPGNATIKGINFYSNALTASTKESFMVRRILFRDITTDPYEAVGAAKDALTLGEIDYGKAKIELPVGGIENTSISWRSDNESVISNDGVVTRQAGDVTVKLTATITKGDVSLEREFERTVIGRSSYEQATTDILNEIAKDLTEESITDEPRFRLTKDLVLPDEILSGRAADIGGVDITWESNYPLIITNDGKITQQPYEMPATLTATITAKEDSNVSVQKELKFAVDIGGTVYHYYNFEDMQSDKAGEEIQTWTKIQKRAQGSDLEYGNHFFADKEPSQSNIPFDKANKALFLNCYSVADYDNVPYMRHTEIKHEDSRESYKGDNVAISFRVKFKDSRDTLEMSTYCLEERYTYFSPSSFSIKNTFEYVPEVPYELNVWHDVLMYFDTLSFRIDVYIDGERVVSEPIRILSGDLRSMTNWRFFYRNKIGYIILDDILLRCVDTPTGEAAVEAAIAKTTVPTTLTEDVDLPNRVGRCSITWRSSDESVVSDSGKINPSLSAEKSATLTAIFRNGSIIEKKEFPVSVPAQATFIKEYSVENINISAGQVDGVMIKRVNDVSNNAKLYVLVYDQDAFSGMYRYDIPAMQIGETQTVAVNIPLNNLLYHKVKAYVWDPDASEFGPSSNYCIVKEDA